MPSDPSDIPHPPSAIELVVFDLGRVLVEIADDLEHAATLAGRRGVAGFTGDLSAHTRRGGDAEVARLLSGYETGKVSGEEYVSGIATRVGADPADIAAVHDAVLMRAYDGLDGLFDALAGASVKTACLSNTNAYHWARIEDPQDPAYLGLHRLDFRCASQQVGVAKPDPAIYARLEQDTGVAPQDILFFDDLPENIDTAHARGWRAEVVPRMDNPLPWVTERLVTAGVLSG